MAKKALENKHRIDVPSLSAAEAQGTRKRRSRTLRVLSHRYAHKPSVTVASAGGKIPNSLCALFPTASAPRSYVSLLD